MIVQYLMVSFLTLINLKSLLLWNYTWLSSGLWFVTKWKAGNLGKRKL